MILKHPLNIMNKDLSNIIPYLTEFRKRLIYSLLGFIFIFIILLYFANDLYSIVALPLLKQLPANHSLIATNIVSPFFVPFELSLMSAFFFTAPLFLYHLWAFITPALYQHERKMIWPFLLISIFLFYSGIIFAYFIVLPMIFLFLIHTTPEGVALTPDIAQYLNFVLHFFLAFGIMFEIPLFILLLVKSNIVTRAKLTQFRPYAIITAFIIGMLLSPPDVISQTIVAIPLWLLYEMGVFLAGWLWR